MRTFCTIVTSNYFAYAVTLYRSLIKFHPEEKLIVLVCDESPLNPEEFVFAGITVMRLKEIYSYKETDLLFQKYAEQQMDAFRWAMKPVLLRFLLDRKFEKVIYVDCDIFFFNNYDFLFDELNTSGVLLSPGWRTIDPQKNEEEFIHLYTTGLYNAGFVGATEKGFHALEWWTSLCLYKITKDYANGFFDDQKYLDVMPLMFQNIKILKHKGCNISAWNQHECRRTVKEGQVFINGTDPIIFVHFNNNYVKELKEGNDHLVFSYLQDYEAEFSKLGYVLSSFIEGLPEYKAPGFLKTVKRKTLLRTRFKNFMHKLIDKI